jgi:hypothetical protein
MKSHRLTQAICAAFAVAFWSHTAYAQNSDSLSVAPFTGEAGFQELRIGGDSWYLAFHGTRKHAIGSVQAGWLARAGQLCESAGKQYIVELRYVGQQVFPEDQVASYEDFLIVRTAGPVYIPIFIPSGPRTIPPSLTPTKVAAIRCVERASGLNANLVAIPTTDAKDAARKAGVSIP